MSENVTTDEAAAIMLAKVDHWYWAEREVCGRASDTEPPCVKSLRHTGDCDGTYDAPWLERFNAWIDHQIAEGRAEMERDAAAPGAGDDGGLPCSWCDLPAVGTAESAQGTVPSCGTEGHGYEGTWRPDHDALARLVADAARDAERVRTVWELADEYERHAGLMRAQEESVGGVDVIQRWRAFEDAAASIRRALGDGP